MKLKKSLGQHFLNNPKISASIVNTAALKINGHRVLEIGPGGGFLTSEILKSACRELMAVEIDDHWAAELSQRKDSRLKVLNRDFIQMDLSELNLGLSTCKEGKSQDCKGAIVLANLPYNCTFPILFRIKENIESFCFGTVMIQEEVAQRILAKDGRDVGCSTMFLNHTMEFQLLEKIGPENFNPPPKVFSRLISFRPRQNPIKIENQDRFWKFIRQAFHWPGKTIKNNIKGSYKDEVLSCLSVVDRRARQCSLLELYDLFIELEKNNKKFL